MHLKKLMLVTMLLVSVSCGSDKSSSSAPAPSLSGAAADANRASGTLDNMALFSTPSTFMENFTAAEWSSTDFDMESHIGGNGQPEDGCDGTDKTPASYMDNMINSNCANSNLLDLKGVLRISCVVFQNISSTNGIPDVVAGASVTITNNPLCDLTVDQPIQATVDVAATTATSIYQRRITMNIGGIPNAYTFWYGKTTTKTNIQFLDRGYLSPGYDGTPGTEGGNTIGFYTYDSATLVSQFELQGFEVGDAAFFIRLHYDEANNVSTAIGTMGERRSPDHFVHWGFQGPTGSPSQANTANPISVIMQWENTGQSADSGNLSTCVNPSTKAASGNVHACGTYEVPTNIGTLHTFLDSAADVMLADLNYNRLSAIPDETTTPNFTSATIHSAALIQ